MVGIFALPNLRRPVWRHLTIMATYTATIYQPGQPAQQLTAPQIASLNLRTVADELIMCTATGRCLVADEPTVAHLLSVHSVDLLVGTEQVAAYVLTDANDFDAKPNPEAEQAIYGVLGELSEIAGPLLLIEEITSQPEAEEEEAEERDPYEYNGDEYWPTYHEARATRYGL